MKKFLMIASAAAMAVSMPAIAKPDKGDKGGGNHAAHSGGNGGGDFKPQKMKGGEFKQAQKAQDRQFKSSEGSMKDRNKGAERFAKSQENKSQEKQIGRSFKQQNKAVERQAKAQDKALERQFKNEEKRAERLEDRFDDQGRQRFGQARFGDDRGFCPPGLAKKDNGCMPPGQIRKAMVLGQQMESDWFEESDLPQDYRDLFTDNSQYYYRHDDNGFIYRVNRENDLVSGLIPLLGGGFSVGQVLPAGFDAYNVPMQYRDQYFDNSDLMYRFGDNAIYQVDPKTQMIQSVVALLTGDSFGIGQTLPQGYDMYNVPTQYRDEYYDTDESMYRYADGNIYQVDPKTQIIQAIISALI